nr:MAG TPA: hypothetical protein [Caudoviricetes sp.]
MVLESRKWLPQAFSGMPDGSVSLLESRKAICRCCTNRN